MTEHYHAETLKDIAVIKSEMTTVTDKLNKIIFATKTPLTSPAKLRNRCYKVDEIKRELVTLNHYVDKFFDMGLDKD